MNTKLAGETMRRNYVKYAKIMGTNVRDVINFIKLTTTISKMTHQNKINRPKNECKKCVFSEKTANVLEIFAKNIKI